METAPVTVCEGHLLGWWARKQLLVLSVFSEVALCLRRGATLILLSLDTSQTGNKFPAVVLV